ATRARKGAADAGVLVEVMLAPLTQVPLPDAGFDLVVVDETAGLLAAMTAGDRTAAVHECLRLLRPGGRMMVIGGGQPTGVGALFARSRPGPALDATATLA